MIHGGMKVKKALLLNLLSALASVLGVSVFFLLGNMIEGIEQFLLPVAIGGFVYIAGSDLVPELKHETSLKTSLAHLVPVLLGIVIMFGLTLME